MEVFDKNYFEFGIESGKSCYQNYRWIPELTIPMAMTMIDYLKIEPHHRILDFGCAKGYLVKAFKWLNRSCIGMDVSDYAIGNSDPEIIDYCYKITESASLVADTWEQFDFCIAKDVFEHVNLSSLKNFLQSRIAKKYFAVIPLGEDGKFNAPANNMDITHINCMNSFKWGNFFTDIGLKIDNFTFRVDGIKDSYYEKYPKSHGFFTLSYV